MALEGDQMKRKGFILLTICLSSCMLFFFQNCGPAFKSVNDVSSENISHPGALAVLKTNCASCHSVGGSAAQAPFGSYTTDREFINSGLVVEGQFESSKLIQRLRNYTGNSSNKNMPPSAPLPEDQYNTLISWISGMVSQENPFQCNSGMTLRQKLQPSELKRLSRRQYLKTLQDLLSRGMPSSSAQSIITTASDNLILPVDDSSNFSRLDSSLSQQHIRAYFDFSDRISTAVVTDPNYTPFVTAIINLNPGACTSINTGNLSTTCATQFINNFGYRALRRPLMTSQGNNEPALYLAAYTAAGGNRQGIGAVIFKFLLAPHFLFMIEDRETLTSSARLYRLSSHSIASRLSYLFWNSMPDENLLSQASNSDLSADQNFSMALTYVSNHANTNDSIREYMNEWLKLSRVPEFATNNPSLNYLANGIALNSSLRSVMLQEVEELGSYVYSQNLPFSELFTTNASFARDSRLMNIYGLSQAAASNVTPQNAVRFPANERAGILTRAALLSFGTELANPIKRGVRIRREILCLPLSNPPAEFGDQLTPPEIDIHATTRERYDIKTSRTECNACHQYINSLGHSLGSYNAFGRFQLQEPTFDVSGNYSGISLDIDTSVNLDVSVAFGLRANNAIEFSRIVAAQRSTQVCFSEKFFKFAIGRETDSATDGCRLNSMFNQIRNSGSLKAFMKAAAQDQEFRHRLMGQ